MFHLYVSPGNGLTLAQPVNLDDPNCQADITAFYSNGDSKLITLNEVMACRWTMTYRNEFAAWTYDGKVAETWLVTREHAVYFIHQMIWDSQYLNEDAPECHAQAYDQFVRFGGWAGNLADGPYQPDFRHVWKVS